jgi:hypothetical protein
MNVDILASCYHRFLSIFGVENYISPPKTLLFGVGNPLAVGDAWHFTFFACCVPYL